MDCWTGGLLASPAPNEAAEALDRSTGGQKPRGGSGSLEPACIAPWFDGARK
jgi:hypothetical protein